MAEDINRLNKYETVLYQQLTSILEAEKMKFPSFLHIFTDEIPDKKSEDYLKLLKKKQMKLRRANLSMEQVFKMLELAGWELSFSFKGKPIKLNDYVTVINGKNHEIRFTDFMVICELFNIDITWGKIADRASKTNAKP